jgi:predicted dehydrogenase
MNKIAHSPIRLGVVGAGRGQTFMDQAAAAGMELVAICESAPEKLAEAAQRFGVAAYTWPLKPSAGGNTC